MPKTKKQLLEEIFYANASPEERLAYDLKKANKKVSQLENLPADVVEVEKKVEVPVENDITGEEIVFRINELTVTPDNQIDFTHVKNFPWNEVSRISKGSDGGLISWGDGGLNLKEVTLAQITADQNDYELGIGSFFRLSSDASRTITGLQGGTAGEGIVIANVGSFDIVLANQSASSGAINRIITGTGANVTLSANDVALLFYDSVTQRWRVQEAPGGSGGTVGPGTINEIAYFDTTTTVASLTTATYPSLTELSYVKGVTSAIQTQINSKQATLTFGIADTNALKVDDASAADNDYAKFTANGLEGVPYSTVLSDIGAASTAGALTQFLGNTAWRIWYSDALGDVTELALGAAGTFLGSNGASSIPSWSTPAGSGDVTKVGTPVDNQIGVWTGDGTIEGDAALTFDTTTNTLVIGSGVLTVDTLTLTGTGTLNGVDAIDATTEATIEAAIDTLANLTSIQSLTVTLADAGADAFLIWDDSASAYQNSSQADARVILGLGTAAYVATDLADLNEATIEAAIDTLANLTSVQGQTISIGSSFTIPADPNADRILFWDDSAGTTAYLVASTGLNITTTNLTVDQSTAFAWTAAHTWTKAGVLQTLTNTTDGSSVQIAIFQGDRATMADNDEAYISLKLSNDGGTQTEVSRITWAIPDVNAGTSEDGRLDFSVMTAGTLAKELQLSGADLSPSTSDGLALGTLSLPFSDLFLASGSVIDWANDVTLTHSANTLTFAGGTIALGTATATGGLTGNVTGDLTGNADTVTWANEATDTTCFIGFATAVSGSLAPKTNVNMTFNSNTGVATFASVVLTTADINGGTLDGAIIGGASAAAATVTTLVSQTHTPATDGTYDLGSTTLGWNNLHMDTGATINIENGNWVATHTSGILTVTTGDLRVTSANVGTNADSVPTLSSTSTFTNKTLTSPTLTTPSAFTTGGTITLAENTSIALDPAGSADGKYSGITVTGTAGTTLVFGDLIYLAVADSRWELTDADAASTAGDVLVGICVLAAAADGSATTILLNGIIRADARFPALTVGAPVYVSTTPGDIQVAQPSGTDDVIRMVGRALTADEIYFNPSEDYATHV